MSIPRNLHWLFLGLVLSGLAVQCGRVAPEQVADQAEIRNQQIYYESFEAQVRAEAESEERYPTDDPINIPKNIEFLDSLYGQYMAVVRDKHGITESQQDGILLNGGAKKWYRFENRATCMEARDAFGAAIRKQWRCRDTDEGSFLAFDRDGL